MAASANRRRRTVLGAALLVVVGLLGVPAIYWVSAGGLDASSGVPPLLLVAFGGTALLVLAAMVRAIGAVFAR